MMNIVLFLKTLCFLQPNEVQTSGAGESTRDDNRPRSRRSARDSSSSSGDSEVAEHNREVLQQKV